MDKENVCTCPRCSQSCRSALLALPEQPKEATGMDVRDKSNRVLPAKQLRSQAAGFFGQHLAPQHPLVSSHRASLVPSTQTLRPPCPWGLSCKDSTDLPKTTITCGGGTEP